MEAAGAITSGEADAQPGRVVELVGAFRVQESELLSKRREHNVYDVY